VVGAETYGEFGDALALMLGDELGAEVLGHFSQAFTRGWEPPTMQEATRSLQRTLGAEPYQQPQQQYRQPAGPPPGGGGGKQCVHGDMIPRSGTSASTGRAWSGFFCPAPKGAPDQCKPIFGGR
jgi:hypothetical protein